MNADISLVLGGFFLYAVEAQVLASVCGGAIGEYYAPVRIGRITGMTALYFDGIVDSHIE